MNKTYLLLGSNMGNSKKQLLKAIMLIEKQVGKITRRSSLYSTAAWGNTKQPDFLNQVIIAETGLTATQTMQTILQIEKKWAGYVQLKMHPVSLILTSYSSISRSLTRKTCRFRIHKFKTGALCLPRLMNFLQTSITRCLKYLFTIFLFTVLIN